MRRTFSTSFRRYPFLKELGLQETNPGVYRAGQWVNGGGAEVVSVNPATNEPIASVQFGGAQDYEECVSSMEANKAKWMDLPAPARGEIVRQIG